ncbi:hypothetical protein J7T55_010246 [Diaporthe amygdali]|uniref:uncharacterized protein n=1 Tax=Phomopsis amygdali TaxID=1214568 RepID=UPI0022FEFE50|nr:uncharacterized protein J7T55_010246 [Diaporthe amygdali]KAJ0114002.1 hypothetical protein J7T55_010246 [Diaporthe amygdali]
MAQIEYRCSIGADNKNGAADAIAVDRVLPSTKAPQGLTISFQRTIRVPGNGAFSQLPPSFGAFPLYKVQDYASRLPPSMMNKRGIFFPMHQKEAMWICFKADAPFMIKIYCGGVNVVSGEHADEDTATKHRRSRLREQGKPIQDYVVVPEQLWLDGMAIEPSIVRQFVAMPIGHSYTVEAQLTGKEVAGGLMFEITPALCDPKDQPPLELFVKDFTNRHLRVRCYPDDDLFAFMDRLHDMIGLPPGLQKLMYQGTFNPTVQPGFRRLKQSYYELHEDDNRTLSDYNIQTGDIFQMGLRLRGGGALPLRTRDERLGIAAGGMIKQNIRQDTHNPQEWVKGLTITISVQILNNLAFRRITGLEPPACPINADTYAQAGLPFFELYEENSTNVSGAEGFGALQSINEIEMARGQIDRPEPMVYPPINRLYENSLGTTVWKNGEVFHIEDPDGLLSPGGPCQDFRTLADLEEELRNLKLSSEGD